jgi:DNA-binding CsgD family transcriptional regulator
MLSTTEVEFHQRLGHLLGALYSGRFWPTLAAFLQEATAFDSWVCMVFRGAEPPILLHQGYNDQLETALFPDYMRELYVLDPFYLFSQGFTGTAAPAAGLYRLDEVAPEYFRLTEYYRRYFVRVVGADELQFLLPLGPTAVLSMSLGRTTRFTTAEVGALCLYQPWVLPLMRHAALAETGRPPAETQEDNSPARPAPASLEERLRSRGDAHLTDREVQTALLVLAGHSTKGIANEMGISPETVKVHRRNVYDKLGVSTQAALFALFLPTAQAAITATDSTAPPR